MCADLGTCPDWIIYIILWHNCCVCHCITNWISHLFSSIIILTSTGIFCNSLSSRNLSLISLIWMNWSTKSILKPLSPNFLYCLNVHQEPPLENGLSLCCLFQALLYVSNNNTLSIPHSSAVFFCSA